jgi:hypothetical protein
LEALAARRFFFESLTLHTFRAAADQLAPCGSGACMQAGGQGRRGQAAMQLSARCTNNPAEGGGAQTHILALTAIKK